MQNAMTRSRVSRLVEEVLEGKGVPRTVASDERLVDAGLTSMDMVTLMLAVEAAFDLLIPSGDITPGNFRTVATIEALVDRLVAQVAA